MIMSVKLSSERKLPFYVHYVNKVFNESIATFYWHLLTTDTFHLAINPTIRRQIADELFECAWPFCEIGAESVKVKHQSISQKQRCRRPHCSYLSKQFLPKYLAMSQKALSGNVRNLSSRRAWAEKALEKIVYIKTVRRALVPNFYRIPK